MSHVWNRLPGVAALLLLTIGLFYAGGAFAQTPEAAPALLAHQSALELDGAGTAWLGTSTALVLLMTLPGLALFYGGMVRRKNVIATITQSVGVFAVVSLVWFIAGYSIAFGANADAALQPYVGSLDMLFLNGVTLGTANSLLTGIPEYLFIAFQMTFAIITPALVTGAFAERMKYSGLLLFTALWSLLIYSPICHWVWGGGFLGSAGVLDFAGGAVVHVNSGVAGLVCAIFLGRRKGYGVEPINPHNPVLTMIGASLLLVGWIGFNAGSAGAANELMGVALLNTVLAAAAAALTWKIIELIEKKKVSLIGMLSGVVAGLVAITPAAGFVDPKGAVIIGLIAGPVCYISSVWIKKLLRYDDSLDAFGIHGAGGLIGALLTGVFATTAINSLSEGANVGAQAIGLAWTIAYSAVGTFIILVICKFTTGLRVSEAEEAAGLDTSLHGEALEH
ncbi:MULTISPECIES: ammonium transporter [Brevundimonas]|jgi:Amt family ammonium transporter|uniref:Ammonium transporter n=2 Tax=Brevundimonas TaxID=41275 RepID=A0A7W9C791_9CAUL|nr:MULTISPECIES: ammonium transporter [Brevundimonas]ALJ08009.1 ammonia channel protein [Brevundimonas sp. DS20]MAL56932.1 ammonium transporter [Brevundimonas sp.]MBB5740400.1 Amt family ammonium transporter [Brevundimonas aurantiaca]MCC4295443.1 ammonium transporter [Brevundimonas aurantiaca]QFU31249.1 Ammonia channel precursor [Brevundimonas sp. Bb-A]